MKTLYSYLKELQISFESKKKICDIFLGECSGGKMTLTAYLKRSKTIELEDDYSLPENYLDLMVEVNMMVKDESCPENLRNRFYKRKGEIIKECIKEGRVSDIWDEGNVLFLVIDGKYGFHQPKYSYAANRTIPEGKREYRGKIESLPFDAGVYNEFQLAAYYYLGKRRYGKDEPKEGKV